MGRDSSEVWGPRGCLPEGQRGGWGAVGADAEGKDHKEEHPEWHPCPPGRHLQKSRRGTVRGSGSSGHGDAGFGSMAGLDPHPLEAVKKRTQMLEVRQTWVQVLPLPVTSSDFSIWQMGMIKLPWPPHQGEQQNQRVLKPPPAVQYERQNSTSGGKAEKKAPSLSATIQGSHDSSQQGESSALGQTKLSSNPGPGVT